MEAEGGVILCGLMIIFFGSVIIPRSENKVNKIELEPHVILPEEFYLAREGDTLYVINRTKDKIELGYKKYKQ